MQNVDYLIVGQGLAGSVLVHKLLQIGKTVCVIDNKTYKKASSVAAGMFNPLVFKRIKKTWLADEILPVAYKYFREIEETFHARLFYLKDIYKLLVKDEYENWLKKVESGELSKYIKETRKDLPFNGVHNFYGHAHITGSGYVDLAVYLYCIKNFIKEKGLYEEIHFNYSDLIIDKYIHWNRYQAKKIVFCEGAYAVNNVFFKEVKYYLTKGDVLTIEIDNFQEDVILNKQIFILPKGNDKYIIGSTYNWSGLEFSINEEDKDYLTEKLNKVLNKSYKIQNHQTGVRPTIRDRRPVLGRHPEISNMYYFNGLGTKGVMLAPYFANEMVNLLENNAPVNEEVDINRFYT